MFWILIIIGMLFCRFGISSMLSYNRVKKENKQNGIFIRGLDFPNTILEIKNPIVRGLRKFFWQASTDGTWQHGVFSGVIFYLGIAILILGVFVDPETAQLLFG